MIAQDLVRPVRLTPQMAQVLDGVRRAGRVPFHRMDVTTARQAYAAASEVLEVPRMPLARVEDLLVPSGDGARLRAARCYAASLEPKLPVLLYLHGGGFTIGDLDTHDSLCRQLAARSGAAVVALDYRLAPEHRFPAAVDDAWSCMAWLAEEGARVLRLDSSRLAVGGDSAGGTLAAVCALRARDMGLPLSGQLLITPGTAATAEHDSRRRYGQGYLLEAEGIDWFFNHYADVDQRHDWRFAPLEADEAEGVAPACMVLAEADPLVDEGLAYADRLRARGVDVELELYRGVTHDFIKMGRALPEAHQAQAALAAFLRKVFHT